MGVELKKINFYVNDDIKTFEEVSNIAGEANINLDKVKSIKELEERLEKLNSKNKNYKITVIHPIFIEYDDKKILFYNERGIKNYFENNYPALYKEKEISNIRDSYDLVKLGFEVKEIHDAKFAKRINFKCNEESKEIER